LFEAAINMDLKELRKRWSQVSLLAFVGTVMTAAVAAAALYAFTGLPGKYAVLLAVMLAPTDPVSVLATMKQHGVAGGLRTLLEGESIFNDAIGIVFFTIALSVAFPTTPGSGPGWWEGTREFGAEVAIGVAVGVGGGLFVHYLMRLLDDRLVEITLSVALSFGTFLISDRLGGSGVMAVVVGGLLIGNYGTFRAMSQSSQRAMAEFWDIITFLINSALFLLIGWEFHATRFGEGPTITVTVVAIIGLAAGRALSVYGLLAPFAAGRVPPTVPMAWVHALYWGGLRGSIPIALALGLTSAQRDLAGSDPVAVVFGAVLFSLLAQGLTFAPLLGRLGLTRAPRRMARREAPTRAPRESVPIRPR
jgi:CPA1 family monovalent cation:H+ antiporter